MIGMFKRRYRKTSEKGYVYGGQGVKSRCDEYDPDTWTNKTSMVLGRYSSTASTIAS